MDYTKGEIYILMLASLEQIKAMYVPTTMDGTRTAKFAEVQPAGRNNPQFHYTGGSEELKLSLSFTAQNETRTDVIEKVNKLKSLCYSDGKQSPPELVKIVFGDSFKNSQWIVKSVNYKYELFNEEINFNPDMARVDISLALAPSKNLKKSDIA